MNTTSSLSPAKMLVDLLSKDYKTMKLTDLVSENGPTMQCQTIDDVIQDCPVVFLESMEHFACMLDSLGDGQGVVPIPKLNAQDFFQLCALLSVYMKLEKPETPPPNAKITPHPFLKEISGPVLRDLVHSGHYLLVTDELIDELCKEIAVRSKGKSDEEMRAYFLRQ